MSLFSFLLAKKICGGSGGEVYTDRREVLTPTITADTPVIELETSDDETTKFYKVRDESFTKEQLEGGGFVTFVVQFEGGDNSYAGTLSESNSTLQVGTILEPNDVIVCQNKWVEENIDLQMYSIATDEAAQMTGLPSKGVWVNEQIAALFFIVYNNV